MAYINTNYRKLSAGYLFPEIARRVKDYLDKNPGKIIHRLGIGNTTEPLTPTVVKALEDGALQLANPETYSGYGDERGEESLRIALTKYYSKKDVKLDKDEFFISDGAKPDSANIQTLFSLDSSIAFQDPSYPVYVDSNVAAGRSGFFNENEGNYEGFTYMICNSDNSFLPDLPDSNVDLIYLCSPNNPTGSVLDKKKLKEFVDYARENLSIIIFDASYAAYISDSRLPGTIYEVDGADECAIEVNSFSKFAGFTGVRLGWTIVPQKLKCKDSQPGELHQMWYRRQTTFFNGASNIAQKGGIAALSEEGLKELEHLVNYYMDNARLIRDNLISLGLDVYGGVNAPYVWVRAPGEMSSWAFFDKLLHQASVVGTPGSGFGPSGEGYLRLSAFGHRRSIEEAIISIRENLSI